MLSRGALPVRSWAVSLQEQLRASQVAKGPAGGQATVTALIHSQ